MAWLGGALLCFQEFESAALLQIDRHPIVWTVWLFDAHAAGEPLSRTLKFVIPALLVQALWLFHFLWLIMQGPALQTDTAPSVPRWHRSRDSTTAGYPIVLAGVSWVLLWPLVANGSQMFGGLTNLLEQRTLWIRLRQILMSFTEAAIAALLALQLCLAIRQWRNRAVTLIALVPGLLGALTISLILLAVFQIPVIHGVYDTWLPMIAGHVLLMLPRAFLLVTVLEILASATSRHSAGMLSAGTHETARSSASRLNWILSQRRWMIAFTVLTHCACGTLQSRRRCERSRSNLS